MDFTQNRPIYLQIVDHFCENILRKQWKQDDRIPSVRDIAVQLEVNPNTAMRAFVYLQEHDVIYNRRGIGYFVSEGAFEKVRELKRNAFLENDVPVFFRTMNLLGFSCRELAEWYEKLNKEHD